MRTCARAKRPALYRQASRFLAVSAGTGVQASGKLFLFYFGGYGSTSEIFKSNKKNNQRSLIHWFGKFYVCVYYMKKRAHDFGLSGRWISRMFGGGGVSLPQSWLISGVVYPISYIPSGARLYGWVGAIRGCKLKLISV